MPAELCSVEDLARQNLVRLLGKPLGKPENIADMKAFSMDQDVEENRVHLRHGTSKLKFELNLEPCAAFSREGRCCASMAMATEQYPGFCEQRARALQKDMVLRAMARTAESDAKQADASIAPKASGNNAKRNGRPTRRARKRQESALANVEEASNCKAAADAEKNGREQGPEVGSNDNVAELQPARPHQLSLCREVSKLVLMALLGSLVARLVPRGRGLLQLAKAKALARQNPWLWLLRCLSMIAFDKGMA